MPRRSLQPLCSESLRRIRTRLKSDGQHGVTRTPYSPQEFEQDVHQLLTHIFPHSVLSNVRLFDPKNTTDSEYGFDTEYGFEIDSLFHVRFGGVDWIVSIECKKQLVAVQKGEWLVQYSEGSKNVLVQIENHVRTLWSYLEPIAEGQELRFIAIVVSSDSNTKSESVTGFRNSEVHLTSIGILPRLLDERFNFKGDAKKPSPTVPRVAQSEFLDILRLSLARSELGHPEYASALRYVNRCRRTLDDTLFLMFKPTPKMWFINGSAGMGKSVLLAYAAAVLSTGRELAYFQNDVFPKPANDLLAKMEVDTDAGLIAIFAMSGKQLENVRQWFGYFVDKFRAGDAKGEVRVRPPVFMLCRSKGDLTPSGKSPWAAVLIDEAHDLAPWAAVELKEQQEKHGFYLIVAGDRHQKLRLSKSGGKLIEGMDFTNKSTRLKQVYRNPAAVYIASLAIMFRWNASTGPKVIPTATQLRDQFGFDTVTLGSTLQLNYKSDAHPANSWSHLVGDFPDVSSAFHALMREKLSPSEVLWVRFAEENPDFNYELLSRHFTYHNCRSLEADKLSDKYIKGQDFAVVVIEGFPSFMDQFDTEEEEAKMWRFRRELYLCASRATCFLYFICDVSETAEVIRIRQELSTLIDAIKSPSDTSKGTARWSLAVTDTSKKRQLDVFDDDSDPQENVVKSGAENSPSEDEAFEEAPVADGVPPSASAEEDIPAPESYLLTVSRRLRISEFAEHMELSVAEVESKLLDLRYVVSGDMELTMSTMSRLAAEWNTTIEVDDDTSHSDSKDEPQPPEIMPAAAVQASQDSTKKERVPQEEQDTRRKITITAPIEIKDLAEKLGLMPFRLIKDLMAMDVFANPNQTIESHVAQALCRKYDCILLVKGEPESKAVSQD